MCTVVISFEPAARYPVLILAVRDELLARPWLPPAAHWPDLPGLLGGIDQLAGGTWLAANRAARRVSCVLNGYGHSPDPARRRSRGELPLLGAAGEPLPEDLTVYEPFHLVTATPGGAVLVSWDGEQAAERRLPEGITVVVNSGVDTAAPRAANLLRRLAETERPDPEQGWGGWLGLAAGEGAARESMEALIIRRGDGYGSSSVSLLAISPAAVRYDFAPVPDHAGPLAGLRTVS